MKVTNTLWRCERLRTGQKYNKIRFDAREDKKNFVGKMRKVEPDLFWRMEAVEARIV